MKSSGPLPHLPDMTASEEPIFYQYERNLSLTDTETKTDTVAGKGLPIRAFFRIVTIGVGR